MKKGFTLIELLVVIAIIAILSAIIFPVFARAKYSAYRSSDMSNMNSIRTALQLYQADQGGYPPVLLGYVNAYGPGGVSNIIPANLLAGALYPKLVNSVQVFRPSLDQSTFGGSSINVSVEPANWPEGILNANAATGSPGQRFGPNDPQVQGCYSVNGGSPEKQPNVYYTISGYDVEAVPNAAGASPVELHYTLFWSNYAVPEDPCNPDVKGSASDSPRQLGYANPPETTVITWDSFFRDPLVGGSLASNKGDLVLFLGGSARPEPSNLVGTQAWQTTP